MSSLIADIEDGSHRVTLMRIAGELAKGTTTSESIVAAYIGRYLSDERTSSPINGYVDLYEGALESARIADEKRNNGEERPLLGLPIAVKDNIHVKGERLSCGSRILSGYTAPYSATVVDRILSAGAVLVGRTNMDEFAMGSSTEFSAYGPSRNPADRTRACGGSSGGSAAVVAAGQAPFALGSDTGGSIRLPASFCGVYGLKPTYGAQSRYGLVAFGSSLDQIGFLSNSPEDMSAVLSVTAGKDPRDETSADFGGADALSEGENIANLRFMIPEEQLDASLDGNVREAFDRFVEWLTRKGARVESSPLPILDVCVAIYYIIAPAEASSNLSRYDGVKYGHRDRDASTLGDFYKTTRLQGFGDEVKRRILIGNYVLSSGYYDAYYKKAQAVRRLLRDEIDQCFRNFDYIVSPTAPTPAFELGSRTRDPIAMYQTDVYTTYANLTGIPSISIPFATGDGLPIGMQVSGPRWSEAKLLSIATEHYREQAAGES